LEFERKKNGKMKEKKEGFDEFLYIQRATHSVDIKVVFTPFPHTVIIVSITASEKIFQ